MPCSRGNIGGYFGDEVADFFHCTVGELLEETARKDPDRPALIYSDRDLKYSYKELNARVDRLAKGMLALGIGKGDHVGIWATNVPDWLTVFYATARIGAVFITVNTSYRPSELEYVMQQSDMKALFIIDGYRDTDYVQALYDLVPELKRNQRIADQRPLSFFKIGYLHRAPSPSRDARPCRCYGTCRFR